MHHLTKLFIATSFGVLAACGQPASTLDEGEPAPDAQEEAVLDSDEFIQTTVWIAADGTTRVTERTITAGQERADAAERALAAERGADAPDRAGIVQDTNCGWTSLWIFDRPGSELGNKLCFAGPGIATLGDYRRWSCRFHCGYVKWELATGPGITPGSYYAGREPGEIVAGVPAAATIDAGVPSRSLPFGPYGKGDLVFPDGSAGTFTNVVLYAE